MAEITIFFGGGEGGGGRWGGDFIFLSNDKKILQNQTQRDHKRWKKFAYYFT